MRANLKAWFESVRRNGGVEVKPAVLQGTGAVGADCMVLVWANERGFILSRAKGEREGERLHPVLNCTVLLLYSTIVYVLRSFEKANTRGLLIVVTG